jgi:hypothetical protein
MNLAGSYQESRHSKGKGRAPAFLVGEIVFNH